MVTKEYKCPRCFELVEEEKEMADTSHPVCKICGAVMDRVYNVQIDRIVKGGYGLGY